MKIHMQTSGYCHILLCYEIAIYMMKEHTEFVSSLSAMLNNPILTK